MCVQQRALERTHTAGRGYARTRARERERAPSVRGARATPLSGARARRRPAAKVLYRGYSTLVVARGSILENEGRAPGECDLYGKTGARARRSAVARSMAMVQQRRLVLALVVLVVVLLLLPPLATSLASTRSRDNRAHEPPAAPPPPAWHLPARCEEGDVNALFQFKGVWHLMQQWHLRPHTSVGHAVSRDLLSWSRLEVDVLTSGATQDEQCYDGSASLVHRQHGGSLSPILQIDGGCGRKQAGGRSCMESAGNGSEGGVTAFPADLNDTNLTHWNKVGPTVWRGCDGSAGPSPIWRNPKTRLFECIAIHATGEARFVAADATLTQWKVADPAFLPAHGGGGGNLHI